MPFIAPIPWQQQAQNPAYAPLPIPQAQSQTAATPVTTGDYRKKRRIAEALRQQQEALAASPRNSPTINESGYTMVNYGGILEDALKPVLAAYTGKKAGEAEDQAMAARREALSRLNPDMTPQDMLALGDEYDIEGLAGAAIERMMPEKEMTRAQKMTLLAQNPALASMLGIPEEEVAGFQAEMARRAEEEYQQKLAFEDDKARIKAGYRQAPAGPAAPQLSALDQERKATMTPEEWAAYLRGKGGAGGGAGGAVGRYNPAREAQVLKSTAQELKSLISTKGEEMFGTGQAVAATAREAGEQIGGLTGTAIEMLGTKAESPANAAMRAMGIDAALEAVAKMAPASDTDVRMLLRSKPNAFQSKESALAFINLMEKVADRYSIPMGDQGVAPVEDTSTGADDAYIQSLGLTPEEVLEYRRRGGR